MRRFQLVRDGHVVAAGEHHDTAWDLELPSDSPAVVRTGIWLEAGWALVRWRGPHQSIVFWPSLDDATTVHSHAGSEIVWLD
jgi:hypothetical protein